MKTIGLENVSPYLKPIQVKKKKKNNWFKDMCLTSLFLLTLLSCNYFGKLSHTRNFYPIIIHYRRIRKIPSPFVDYVYKFKVLS